MSHRCAPLYKRAVWTLLLSSLPLQMALAAGENRVALSRAIVAQLFPGMNELSVLTLDPQLESILASALTGKQGGGLEPGLAEGLLQSATRESDRIEQQGLNPVLLTPPGLRPVLSKFLRRALPQLAVLSHNEIPDNKNIRVVGVVGGRS